MQQPEVIAEGLAFPEGPVVMEDGSVIVVETFGGRVTRCWNVYEACADRPLSAPNDLVFDCDGNLWFTDFGRMEASGKQYGGLYCARPDGSSITQIADRATSFNGVGISPDMTTVYVADTIEARVYRFGRKLERQTPCFVATVPGKVRLDSLAITAAGNICVATIGEQGAISTVTPQGEVSAIATGDQVTTNIASGGPGMRFAWITYSMKGMLVKMRWSEAGMRLVYGETLVDAGNPNDR